ncbi:MAG TPA: NnrS family protein [Gammaproteobacteria bacterium]|nr:NnrS family protein [Gammaproteobacteria bacterium]
MSTLSRFFPSHTRSALLQQPFRLFFLGSASFASLGMLSWSVFLHLGWLPTSSLPALLWHGHEMLFGFAGALIAGFLLTAVGNWTGQATTTPASLILLFCVWLAARLAFLLPGLIPFGAAAIVDCAFFPLLAFSLARPILRSRNYRNLFVIPLLSAFALADILFCLGVAQLITLSPYRVLFWVIDLLAVLMLTIGGRVIPFFTSRRFPGLAVWRKPWLERSVNGGAAILVVMDIILPDSFAFGILSLVVAVLALIRLSGWQSWHVGREPMLWVLHLGYLWLIAGLTLRGIALLGGPLREITALHAITAGALGSLAIGMMLRVAQGHTGRILKANPAMICAFGLVSIAALLRVTDLPGLLSLAGLLWAAAFGILLLVSLPIHLGRLRV